MTFRMIHPGGFGCGCLSFSFDNRVSGTERFAMGPAFLHLMMSKVV